MTLGLKKRLGLGTSLTKFVGADILNKGVVPPYPAPSGYRWSFVVSLTGQRVVSSTGQRVITLQRTA